MNYDNLADLRLDLTTGAPIIDADTADGVLIRGTDVILQDAAIRLRTQIGSIQRMGLDAFGWDYISRIKADIDISTITDTSRKIEKALMQDTRVTMARAVPIDRDESQEAITYACTIFVGPQAQQAGSITITV